MYTEISPESIEENETKFAVSESLPVDIPKNLTPATFKILNNELEGKITVESPERAAELAVSFIRWTLEHRYGPNSETPKSFHDVGHTEMVANISENISQKLIENDLGHLFIMSQHDFDLLPEEKRLEINSSMEMRTALSYQKLLTWAHDLKQNGVFKDFEAYGATIKQLVRDRGVLETQNEGGSAVELFNLLDKFMDINGKPVFGNYPLERCMRDTNATYVNYEEVKEYGFSLLNQTFFLNASLSGQILALTDLAGNLTTTNMYIPGFRDIVQTGNREFFELFPGFSKILLSNDVAYCEKFAVEKKAYEWVNPMQVNFVSTQVWAANNHIKKMGDMHASPKLVETLKELFSGSWQVILSVKTRAQRLAETPIDGTTELGDWIENLALRILQGEDIVEDDYPKIVAAAKILAKELQY